MFGYNVEALFGLFLGSMLAVALLSLLFRYALLGPSGTRAQQAGVALFTGVVSIGLAATGAGLGSYFDRLTNPTEAVPAVIYAISAAVVAALFWFRGFEAGRAGTGTTRRESRIWRGAALVIVVPVAFTGLANITLSTLAGPPSGSRSQAEFSGGTSPEELREIMLQGELASFWRLLDERAPQEMDYIIERFLRRESEMLTEGDGLQFLNQELANLRVSLSAYAPALTDEQRKDILQDNLAILQVYEGNRVLCADVAMTGGVSLTTEQLGPAAPIIDRSTTRLISHLLDAREASAGRPMPTPPTEGDYAALFTRMYEEGITDEQLAIIFEEDASDPQFCAMQIAFLEAVIQLDGSAGSAVRYEIAQAVLSAG